MVDIDEFKELFDPEPAHPLGKVPEVFPEVLELKPTKITWKGKTTTVYDYDLFKGIIGDWIKRDKLTKEQALDLFFEMI